MSGSEDEASRSQPHGNEQVLAFKKLEIQQKRFYLDVKQNNRGRFIKIAEFAPAGRKNRLLLSIPIAHEFKNKLTELNNVYVQLGPQPVDSAREDGRIGSVMLVGETRRYYLDLKENDRGRFVRVSQTIRNNRTRSQIGIPAQGMIEFRDALTDLLNEYGDVDAASPGFNSSMATASSNHTDYSNHSNTTTASFNGNNEKGDIQGTNFRVENKRFFFDVRKNSNGVFMRVSEVKNNFRAAITIPDTAWERFRDIFAEYSEKVLTNEPAESDDPDNNTSELN